MTADHWDAAYAQGDTTRGWYQPQALDSLRLMEGADVSHDAAIIDIGGGASVLVDDLLAQGFRDITVLDQSPVGLALARQRLGAEAASVSWIVDDLLAWEPSRTYDVWHDRAVLHFLLTEDARQAYVRQLLRATSVGALIVIGVFGQEGPPMCAGLPVHHFTPDAVAGLLGTNFEITQTYRTKHVRPDGDTQDYLWTAARRHA